MPSIRIPDRMTLAVSMEMLWASIGMGIIGAILLSNGIWSWFSLPWF